MDFKKLLASAIHASIKAGIVTLEVYNSDFAVESKDDKSPLTLADKKSNEIIENDLKAFEIPVLSEEGRDIAFEERKDWPLLWIVDPLDGTKEFVKRNGEFTVNIALIHDHSPCLGVIYVPVTKTLYFALEGLGSYKLESVNTSNYTSLALEDFMDQALLLPIHTETSIFTVVGSRSHMNDETRHFIDDLKTKHSNIEIMPRGSSLKLCMIAEGKADVYPRFAPTMEWDIAAGQAIVEQAGGKVIMKDNQKPLVYNKKNLVNPSFLVSK